MHFLGPVWLNQNYDKKLLAMRNLTISLKKSVSYCFINSLCDTIGFWSATMWCEIEGCDTYTVQLRGQCWIIKLYMHWGLTLSFNVQYWHVRPHGAIGSEYLLFSWLFLAYFLLPIHETFKGTVMWDFLSKVIPPKVPNWSSDSWSKTVLYIDSNSTRNSST